MAHSTYIITFVAHQLGITPCHVSLCNSVLQRLVICVVNFHILLSKLSDSILFRQTNTAILQWCKYCCCNINIVTLKGKNNIVRLTLWWRLRDQTVMCCKQRFTLHRKFKLSQNFSLLGSVNGYLFIGDRSNSARKYWGSTITRTRLSLAFSVGC